MKFSGKSEIQTDYLIPFKRLDVLLINKKTKENLLSCGFCRSVRPPS